MHLRRGRDASTVHGDLHRTRLADDEVDRLPLEVEAIPAAEHPFVYGGPIHADLDPDVVAGSDEANCAWPRKRIERVRDGTRCWDLNGGRVGVEDRGGAGRGRGRGVGGVPCRAAGVAGEPRGREPDCQCSPHEAEDHQA